MGRVVLAVLLGGLVAGLLDILYALVVYGPLSYGLTPVQVLQSVAAGWVGRDAASAGGVDAALLGLGTHFLIATMMAGVFVLPSPQIRALRRRPVRWGFLYGLVLFAAMNYLVVPLSASATGSFAANSAEAMARLTHAFSTLRPSDPAQFAGAIFTHTMLVGVPIALIGRRFGPSRIDVA